MPMNIANVVKPGMRVVFFISDRTGLTAETYGKNLLAQFPTVEFETFTLAFVTDVEKARQAVAMIAAAQAASGLQAIVFSSLMEKDSMAVIQQSQALVIDLFDTFLEPLEKGLGIASAHTQGISKSILGKTAVYQKKLDAIDYTMNHDDGVHPDQYQEAEVILIGVSRCGKTPSALYLAMNFSLRAANYPLTEEDLSGDTLPKYLLPHRHKLVALTITPAALSRIRTKRRPDSRYAALATCQYEIKQAEAMFNRYQLPTFDTTDTSIEEIASYVVRTLGLSQERIGFA